MQVTTMPYNTPRVHVRRLDHPSPSEVSEVIKLMRLAFEHTDLLHTLLSGNLSPARIDALHGCYVRAALVPGEGEIWVAEVDRTEAQGLREMVGESIWFLPGSPFLSTERQREAANLLGFAALVGEEQTQWFLNYVTVRFALCIRR
ncbi:hypothetical protein CALCODRAFT_361825 [Calocera cornea HHB12733]|uniref:Uncharacterized protein n=1 Tax=Calocera cornea HHB12733 TaxID=1353952 RepID=A0A165ELM2_9BASI|nr:hypothetical protein CALCODRAFT_361825 [Calocera cornea HHB12733]